MSSNSETNGKGEDSETFPLISFVMMRNTEFPSQDELVVAIQKRVPGFEPTQQDEQPEDSAPLMGTVDGKMCAIMLINTPNPLKPDESFIQSAWWWPNINQDVEERKSHAIITLMAAESTLEDHTLLAQLTGAIVETNDTIGVLWNGADAAWYTDMFLGVLNQYGEEPPLPLFVSIKLGQDTQFPAPDGSPAWLGMTFGLMAFGMREIEMRGFIGKTPEKMIDIMQDIAGYLLSSGPVINDGDTVDPDEQTKITIKFEDSTLNPNSSVYRLYMN